MRVRTILWICGDAKFMLKNYLRFSCIPGGRFASAAKLMRI